MKITDRVACPRCTMFTWVHELVKGAGGVLVCGACSTRYVHSAQHDVVGSSKLHLVHSAANVSPLTQQVAARRVA